VWGYRKAAQAFEAYLKEHFISAPERTAYGNLTNSYAFQHSFSTQFKRDESCALYNNRGSDGSEFGGLFGLQAPPNW